MLATHTHTPTHAQAYAHEYIYAHKYAAVGGDKFLQSVVAAQRAHHFPSVSFVGDLTDLMESADQIFCLYSFYAQNQPNKKRI